jgi:hypothetical protein
MTTTLSQFRPAEVLANEALTVTSPIAAGTAGQIPYSEGAGVTGLISVGSDGQVLTLVSGSPAWQSAPVSSLTTSYVGYGVSGVLGGSSDFSFENSDGSSTLTIGDGETNTNQGIVQGPNGIGIVIKGGHSNGNTTNAALSLTSSSDTSGASGAGNAVLVGGTSSGSAGGNVTVAGGDGSTAGGNATISAGSGTTPGSILFNVAGSTYATVTTAGLFVSNGASNGGTLSYSNNDQISGDPALTISATGITLSSSSDPVVVRAGSMSFASQASSSADGNIFMSNGSLIVASTTAYLELIGASELVFGVGSPGTAVGFAIDTSGGFGIGANSPQYGAAGQLFTSGGTGAAPSWTTPSVTVTTGTGLAGGGTLSLGGTLTLTTDPTSSPTFAGITITGTPTNSTDVATKGYVDDSLNGLSWKNEVYVATTANITLSGEQTIDGYGTSASRVLVKNQTDQTQNGIYTSGAGAWTRTTDASTGTQLDGAAVFVTLGSQAGTAWTQNTGGSIVIGTTDISWVQFGAPGGYSAGYGMSLAGNVFNNAGVLTVNGTANQIISSGTTGNIILSLPQDIATTSAPTFIGTNFTGIPNAALTNNTVTISTGAGLSGGGTVALGGTLTLANTGVTSAVAGTGISVSGATGAVTIANTGVTSLTGTTNQISVSASTGGITLSIPSAAFIGNALQIGGGIPGPSSPSGATFQSGTGSSGFAIYSSVIATQSSSNYSLGFDGSNTSVNGTTSVTLALNGTPVVAVTAAGTSVTGTLSATSFSGSGASLTGLNIAHPVIATSAYTASVNDLVIADTTAGAFTVTLPASPVFGERVYFADGGGTWGTNNLTVSGNGAKISGSLTALIVTESNDAFSLIYYNSTRGWIIAP